MLFMYLLCFTPVHGGKTEELFAISCKDYLDRPVDWWYIYKLPRGSDPHTQSGVNFSYVLPHTAGRWLPSSVELTGSSMLQYTLDPFFDPISDYATLVYGDVEPTQGDAGTAANGILIANELGGIWIAHTIPGFPDLKAYHVTIPDEENGAGHLLMCLNLDVYRLNQLVNIVEHTQAQILQLHVPLEMRKYLPDWERVLRPVNKTKMSPRNTKSNDFITRDSSLRGIILYRRPGDTRCIYKIFAYAINVVLDVYGHHGHRETICAKNFGIRNIDTISVNFPDHVTYYIDNQTDSFEFAVSTGARWQTLIKKPVQYWTCFSNLEGPDPGQGGIVVCANNYELWLTFDNLKVKEPECPGVMSRSDNMVEVRKDNPLYWTLI